MKEKIERRWIREETDPELSVVSYAKINRKVGLHLRYGIVVEFTVNDIPALEKLVKELKDIESNYPKDPGDK